MQPFDRSASLVKVTISFSIDDPKEELARKAMQKLDESNVSELIVSK